MSGELIGGVGIGLFACVLGIGGIVGALRRRAHRDEIAATYGETGGVAYTIVQAGCSGLLVLGGIAMVVIVLLIKR